MLIVILLIVCGCVSGYSVSDNELDASGPGEPLYITKYLMKKQFAKARELSRVGPLPNSPNVESYSGYFTVNGFYNSNMFFWFFPALNKNINAPVILWLQGGPGLSGLFGAYVEHGPYAVKPDMTSAEMRQFPWNKEFHTIYVDSPIGTGFSFTDVDKGKPKWEIDIAGDLYEFLQQFFALFSEYRKNDFYIMGESYGGKYVPTLAYVIHNSNNSRLNLKGIAIGNGMCDPETMLDYSSVLYNLGLVDSREAELMSNVSGAIVSLIREKKWDEALFQMDKLIIKYDVWPLPSYFQNFTGFSNYYNFLRPQEPKEYKYYLKYIQQDEFRRAVHVGNRTFHDGSDVVKHLFQDIMQGMREEITTSVNNYKVLFYNGQMDLIIPYTQTINFIKSLKWKYAQQYKEADRHIWKVEGKDDVAGYVHNVEGFYDALVRNGGHILPHDQPEATLDLITRFIRGTPFA